MKRKILNIILILSLAIPFSTVAFAQEGGPDRVLPAGVEALKLDTPLEADVLDSTLIGAQGKQQIIIRLKSRPVAENDDGTESAQVAHKGMVDGEQAGFLDRVLALDPNAKVLAEVQLVLNAVIVEVDASVLPELADDPSVIRIAPVGDYKLDLSETVPYIGAAEVQSAGLDGSGIRVAVLDSGIDYYHENLGGSGADAYDADDPSIVEPGTFPTAKVVGGYDFVGADWPDAPEAPDPDPLDKPAYGDGHGTHVADIIGGVNGVAPGVKLYAVKVCSSVSTACSGVALIQGMEFAVDPNGDGRPNDAVDIINMSLGSPYGQPFDDDLSTAVNNATKLGVLTVASAGNSGDKPFVVGTPSAALTALSVAQTQVPSASLQLLSVDGVDYPAVFQSWSVPLTDVLSGPVQYGDGAGGNLDGCAPFATDSLTDLIVLVDRGSCNFTLKISNISQAGGLVGIIGLVDTSAPFDGGDGGDRPIDIPGYMISQADADAIRAQIGGPGMGTADPANQLPLIGQMVGSSSRGPQNASAHLIKPEIGAPGASVSAVAGTGDGLSAFGGTSGAAPMVTGSAALLLDAFMGRVGSCDYDGRDCRSRDCDRNCPPPNWTLAPAVVKALLMNTGETNIKTDPFTDLAPISRIGGGEVRVNKALAVSVAAWDMENQQGALSFGMHDVGGEQLVLVKYVVVKDLRRSGGRITYKITPTFRYEDDEATGAVTVKTSSHVTLRPGQTRQIKVTLMIDSTKLPGNFMNSGSQGANPTALTINEFDGYILFDNPKTPAQDDFHLAWHVLPRLAAHVVPETRHIVPGSFPQTIGLNNTGVGLAQNDAYALIAVSPNQPEGGEGEQSPTPDLRAVGVNTFPVPAGYCSAEESFVWAFAINSWERQQHLVPVKYFVSLDTNQDGVDDYIVLNNDQSIFSTGSFGTISDGRQLTLAYDLAAGAVSAYFYAEHSTNTGNTVLFICGEQVGLTGTDMLATNVNMTVEALDFYFGGPGDFIDGLTVTPLGEQYYADTGDILGNSLGAMDVYDFGPFPGNSPELGLMLLTNGDRGEVVRGGATQDTEALLFYGP
jgi:subtilisin family serine protease